MEQIPFGPHVSVVGSVLLLVAYALLQLGVKGADSYIYQWFNLIGAACLTYSVIAPFNVGVFVTEFCWTCFSILGVYKTWRVATNRREKRLAEEAAAAGPAGPAMPAV